MKHIKLKKRVTTDKSSNMPHFKVGGKGRQIPPYRHEAKEDDALSLSSLDIECSSVDDQPLGGCSTMGLSSSAGENTARLQEQVHESRRLLEKEWFVRNTLEKRCKSMEKENVELITRLEETVRGKSRLENEKIDIAANIRALEYELAEEVTKQRNLEMILNKTRSHLMRKEEQFAFEVDARQKVELLLLNVQMELRTSNTNLVQLQEERDGLAQQLYEDKDNENMDNNNANERANISEQFFTTNEAVIGSAFNWLEEGDGRRKVVADTIESMRSELTATKNELKQQKAQIRDDHTMLISKNDDLTEKMEELKSDIKLQEEARVHAMMQYKMRLTQHQTNKTMLTSSLDKEQTAREKLDMEVESIQGRLAATMAELEKSEATLFEIERNRQEENEEWRQLLEWRTIELNTLKETNQNLSHCLGSAEAKVSAVENELQIATTTQVDCSNQLSTIQQELAQRDSTMSREESLLKERETAKTQLEKADENRKVALDQVDKFCAELHASKMELNRCKTQLKDDNAMLDSKNNDLSLQNNSMKADMKVQEEARAHDRALFDIRCDQLKTDNQMLTESLKKEHEDRDKLDKDFECLHKQLRAMSGELEKLKAEYREIEKLRHKDKADWTRILAKRDESFDALKASNQKLQRCNEVNEMKFTGVENKLHFANATLIERTNLLSTVQRELDEQRGSKHTLGETVQKDREDKVRLATKIEAVNEQLSKVLAENTTLKEQLDQMRINVCDMNRNHSVTDEKMGTALALLKSDQDKACIVIEEKNGILQEQISYLRAEICTAEKQRAKLKHQHHRALSEQALASKRLMAAENSLKLLKQENTQIKLEKTNLMTQVEKLHQNLDKMKENLDESNRKAINLTEQLRESERTTEESLIRINAQAEEINNFTRMKQDFEHLQAERYQLEVELKKQLDHIESIQKELKSATMIQRTMEDLLSHAKEDNASLDIKLLEYSAAVNLANKKAQDIQELYESEVQKHNQLDRQIAQLEKEHAQLTDQMAKGNKKTVKLMEVKKNVEIKLNIESQRACQLQKEVTNLASHLKSAKVQITSHLSNSHFDRSELEQMKSKLEDESRIHLNVKLEKINAYLEEQSKARESLDKLRDSNESEMQQDFQQMKTELKEELDKLRGSNHELMNNIKEKDYEIQKLQGLYENEIKLRETMTSKFECSKLNNIKSQTFKERQLHKSVDGILQSVWQVSPSKVFQGQRTTTSTLSNELPLKMREELNRSIAKHIEKGPQIDISLPARILTDAKTSNKKGSKDYIEVLKKNYMIT